MVKNLRLPMDLVDALRSGEDVVLVHQNKIYAYAVPVEPPISFARPATDEEIADAWKGREN